MVPASKYNERGLEYYAGSSRLTSPSQGVEKMENCSNLPLSLNLARQAPTLSEKAAPPWYALNTPAGGLQRRKPPPDV